MVEIPYKPEEPRTIRLLFTRIAKNYDLTNHIISLGFDVLWRRKFVHLLKGRNRIADICCGSGAMFPLLGSRILAGVDFTRAMLQIAARHPGARLIEGDAQKIPLQNGTCDAAIIVYSVRNIPDLGSALSELHRIMEAGGLLAILDFGVPEGRLMKKLYLLYFQKLMPFLGSFVARDRSSYHYFVNSVLRFPKRSEFLGLMEKAGFKNCKYLEYTGGAALVYLGER
jgi:demethylmenaquinone methyltransferase/2-methoxy-6-polyprenyl-1,4-benzoquinol methylase